jgi:hypothetical protein
LIVVRYVVPVQFIQNVTATNGHRLGLLQALLPFQAGVVVWSAER